MSGARSFLAFSLLLATVGGLSTSGQSPAKAPPPLNVSGRWEASNMGFYGKMRQVDGVISGRCGHDCAYEGSCDQPGISQCYVRGAFLGDHVVFTAFTTLSATSAPCERSTFIAPNTGKVSPLVGKWYGEWTAGDGITRTSADGGAPVAYPYADELVRCGDIVTYELSFDVASAVIKNPTAPVLAAMADLLKATASARLRVVGHTDATGSAATNKKLSLDRATSVKNRIVELSKADPSRIEVEGMGPDQPIESNDTPAGRAMNRRVEITKAW